jgi:hypothetical protein
MFLYSDHRARQHGTGASEGDCASALVHTVAYALDSRTGSGARQEPMYDVYMKEGAREEQGGS